MVIRLVAVHRGSDVEGFPSGTYALLFGLVAQPEFNEQYVVSRGVNPGNADQLHVVTATGTTLSVRPTHLAAGRFATW